MKCTVCGDTTSPGPAKCPQCQGALVKSISTLPAADSGMGCALLAMAALGLGALGFVLASQATLGAVVVAEALLLAVLARIAQAGIHQRQLRE